MQIRAHTLPIVVGLLTSFVVVLSGYEATDAFIARQRSVAFLKIDETSTNLLKSAGEWAIERGATNMALAAQDPVRQEMRAKIDQRRAQADEAFGAALDSLSRNPVMKKQEIVTNANESFAKLKSLRQDIDKDLQLPKAERNNERTAKWVPSITQLIDTIVRLRQTMEILQPAPRPEIMQFVSMRHMAAEMAEYAGRERARLSAILETRKPMTLPERQTLAQGRGHIDLAWAAISIMRQSASVPQNLKDSIDTIETAYMKDYGQLREQIFAASETGDYPLASQAYFEKVTAAINTILSMSAELGKTSTALSATAANNATLRLTGMVFVLFLGIALSVASLWVTFRRVIGPLKAMRELANTFESNVKNVVETVNSASGTLHTTASSLNNTSEQTSTRAATVAAASEEATTNVQTVASATEELATAIRQIGSLVGRATETTEQAKNEGHRVDSIVHKLTESAQKIGEIIGMISSIATQTNLLALNATIEAARAGEAGKGFAIVASEVKTLANQTAHATDEITRQITSIQEITTTVAESLRGITDRVDEINTISASIRDAIEQQSLATQEISSNVQQAATGTTQVTNEISMVVQATQESGTAARDVYAAATTLASQSGLLHHEVNAFLEAVRRT